MAVMCQLYKTVLVLVNLSVIMASSLQSLEQSCVLSLVVPRDKIKTSCAVDDKVKRRINTLETKINIYKQQVLELETQIHKERLLNNDKIMSLEAMLSKMDKLEDLEKRVSYLENNQQETVNDFGFNRKQYKFSNPDLDMPSDPSSGTITNWRKFPKQEQDTKSVEKEKLLQELENMKKTINETGKNLMHKVEGVLKNATNVKFNKTFTNSVEDSLDNENGSAFSEYMTDENNNHVPLQNDQPIKPSKNYSNDTITDGNFTKPKTDRNFIPTGSSPLISQLEEMLKQEINSILNNQMEEVISLVKKQQLLHNGFEDQFSFLSDQHLSDVKYLNDKVATLELTITSITQTMDDFYSKTVRLQALPSLFEEFKKNMSDNRAVKSPGRHPSTIEKLDEHDKTLRKMERLTEIFQRSLEHYRNESKATYKELNQKLSVESSRLQIMRESLLQNVSNIIENHSSKQNKSLQSKLTGISSLLTSLEDQNVLMQVDLDTMERKLKSKMSKVEHDLTIAKQDIQGIGFSQGKVQKKQKSIEDKVNSLEGNSDVKTRLEILEKEIMMSRAIYEWVDYQFAYDSSRTQCFGKQYIMRTKYRTGRFVGVVLCNENRYKIFLGQNLTDIFLNIGDENGLGQDHCEYVGGNSNTIVKVSSPSMSFKQERGYSRKNWGEEPRIVYLDFLLPSPSWYECGIKIP